MDQLTVTEVNHPLGVGGYKYGIIFNVLTLIIGGRTSPHSVLRRIGLSLQDLLQSDQVQQEDDVDLL